MDTCKLTLVPDYGSSIQMVLSSVPFMPSDMDEMILNREYIYSDQPYHAELHDISEKIEDLSFFVNDMEIESAQEENNVISFGTDRRIFTHNYGFVQITLNIKLENQTIVVLYSKFIPILVVNVRNNRSVERMVEYIYTHREQFLLCGSQPSMQNHGLKAEGKKDLESQIQIIRDIIQAYNETIGYLGRKILKTQYHEGKLSVQTFVSVYHLDFCNRPRRQPFGTSYREREVRRDRRCCRRYL